jgi:hypothetical protein
MKRLFRNIFRNTDLSTPVQPIHPGEKFALIKLNMPEGVAFVTVNRAYDDYKNKHYYAWLVGVELQIVSKNENGHPIDQEAARLNVIQDELEAFLRKKQTVHSVARVTRNGFRDLLIYIDKPKLQQEEIDAFFADILKEREVNFSIHKDPSWNAVSGFLSEA